MPIIYNQPNPGYQTNAIAILNDYVTLAQNLSNMLQIITDLKLREANHAYSTIFAATATYSVNADGTAGAQDATPTSNHPMVGTSITDSEVQGFVGYIVNDLYNFLTGVAGPTVADRRPAIKGMLP